MINKTPNNTQTGEEEIRKIITTRNKGRRSLMERYERKIKNHEVTNSKRTLSILGYRFVKLWKLWGALR